MAHAIDFQNLTQIHNQSLMEEVGKKDMKKLLSTFTEELGGSQLDSGFFQDNNDVKYIYIYINTKVKTINLLTNVSDRRYKSEDVEKTNFDINVFSFLTQTEYPNFQNSIIDVVNNRSDLRKCLLATRDYGRNIQENINAIVPDGKFNHLLCVER